MRTPVAGLVAGLCLLGAAPLPAQEEASFQQLLEEVRDRLQSLDRLMHERQTELVRRIRVLERLARGADALAREAPLTGRDIARQAVAEAREIAAEEPLLDRSVFQALERAEAELLRGLTGSPPGATVNRYLAATLAIEQTTNDALSGYLNDVRRLSELAAGIARTTEAEHANGTQAIDRLLRAHAAALQARDAAMP